MTANVHELLHLPETVKKLGPLWAHSCFPFEAANGVLLKLIHGSQSTEKQVSTNSLQAS
jgi:cell division FtsZ-interacting protein ZapD